MYACIHTLTFAHIHTNDTYIHVWTDRHAMMPQAQRYKYMHAYLYTYIHTDRHAPRPQAKRYTYIHAYMYIYIHAHIARSTRSKASSRVIYIRTCIHVHMHTCTHCQIDTLQGLKPNVPLHAWLDLDGGQGGSLHYEITIVHVYEPAK